MRCEIFNPEITSTVVVDTYDNSAGITYAANTSLADWEGKLWLAFDACTEGFTERSSPQRIWMMTSDDDGETWSEPFQPFRDSAYCMNPMSTTPHEQQPNLVVVGDELWCLWNGQDTYISKLPSPTGKWTNARLEYVGGEQAFTSATLVGSAGSGRIRYPSVDGITDWTLYIAGDPIILSSGVIACPATFLSAGHFSTQIVTSNGFLKVLKINAMLTTTDGVEWSISRVPPGLCGDYTSWEPYLVENPVGVVMFSRNVSYADTAVTQFVSYSFDGGLSFTAQAPSKIGVPSSRGAARQAAVRRWVMAHCDYPSDGGNYDRSNGSLFFSSRGLDDFVPGVNFSGFASYVKYPAIIIKNNVAYINYTTGLADSNTSGRGRTLVRLAKVPLPEDDETAYIFPRMRSEFSTTATSNPQLVASTPPAYKFNGQTDRIVSAATVSPSSGLTFTAWIMHDADPPFNAALIDIRSALTGSVLRVCGSGVGSVDVWHGFDMPINKPIFTASVIDPTAMTVTAYVAYGQSDFFTKTSYFKSILFSGQPSNNETITINGTVYTFKASAAVPTDVQIGASSSATAANLRAAINTAMGTNNNASTFNLDTRIVVARTDGASFSATSSATNVTVESSVSLAGGVANFGAKRVGSSIPNYHGSVYDARIYDGALSTANMRNLYNARRTEFGYSTAISGTSTAPSSPLMRVNPASPDGSTFPPVSDTRSRCEINGETLRLRGEASAGVDGKFPSMQIGIRYKLSAIPASTDKYVIASFGVSAAPARLYINGANPNDLYLNGTLVGTVTDPTAWNTITVIVGTNKAIVGGIDYYFEGKPRCYLGNAWPESLLAASKNIEFDTSAMTVTRA